MTSLDRQICHRVVLRIFVEDRLQPSDSSVKYEVHTTNTNPVKLLWTVSQHHTLPRQLH